MLGQLVGVLPVNTQHVYGSNGSFGSVFNGVSVNYGNGKDSNIYSNPPIQPNDNLIKNQENRHESICKSR